MVRNIRKYDVNRDVNRDKLRLMCDAAVRAALIGVVDDDDAIRHASSSFIRSAGFRCVAFKSALHFLASEAVNTVDCLLLDIRMPGMNGLELQHELAGRIPIIFVTAVADGAFRQQALGKGAVAFILKPFDADELLNAIVLAIDHRGC